MMLQKHIFDFCGELFSTQACQGQLPNGHDFGSFLFLGFSGTNQCPWDSPRVIRVLCTLPVLLLAHSLHSSDHPR